MIATLGAGSVNSLLVRRARLVPLDGGPAGDPVDLRLASGLVAEVGVGLANTGEPELDSAGHWVIPGLWDQHVHAAQAARAASWFDLSGATSAADVLGRLAARLAGSHAPADPGQVVVGFGYRSNEWPDAASVADLDAVSGARPVVLIAGDAHNGWLNSRAQELLGVGPHAGAVYEADWFAIFDRLGVLPGFDTGDAALGALLAHAASKGITGIVDLEFGGAHDDWPGRVARGLDAVRVRAGVYPHQLDEVIGRGLRTGDVLDGAGRVTMGPLKVISDGSLGTATAWCCEPFHLPGGATSSGAPNLPADALAVLVARATAHGLHVAVHAIGDRACALALDTVAAAGASGTIEHAQLIRDDDVPRFAGLGVAASVQPLHLLDDRDAIDRLWPDRADRCFPFRSLLDAGAELRFGSDAPVAPIEPWAAMAAAVHRSDDGRASWHPEQSITAREALASSVDGRRLRVGEPADLVVLSDDPLCPGDDSASAAARLRAMPVLATVCAGRVTFANADGG